MNRYIKPNEYQVTLYVRTPHYVTVEAFDEEGAEQAAMQLYARGGDFDIDRPIVDSSETDVSCVRNNTPEVDDDARDPSDA